jgi:threonyl-tRNA synthetase
MAIITLPDNRKIIVEKQKTIAEIVTEVYPIDIQKNIIAAKVANLLVDLSYIIEHDNYIEFITADSKIGLDIIRHSTAHLMAQAVKELFPAVQLTIGPVIEDGFYYDFYYPPGFTESDLPRIEEKMHELVQKNLPIIREIKSRTEAILLFISLGENYKVKIIEEIPEIDNITLYRQGDFVDLCRGPHVFSTGLLRAFKLIKLSGAYWRGDSKNEILQRVYGTAWLTQSELDNYLSRLEQAKQRDHRLLGKKMDLFHIQDEAPGMIFWHPNGWAINKELRNYIASQTRRFGYQEVNTPQLLDRSLWEKSGHWDKFAHNMFLTESEKRTYAIKPMNCPGHIQIFKQGIKSYRDLPIRYSEFGSCHRNEASGTLHGILRVRGFVQDDGHILCTEDQIASESAAYVDQLREVYADLGFTQIITKLATRPEKRLGSDEIWDKAEHALANVLNMKNIVWEPSPGEGAFYGPKIEFSLKDSLGRVWQCGTLQVDFAMPERLGAFYIAEDGSKQVPVMLHRAMLGAIERFIGILIEETGGNLPFWLAPIQVIVLTITDKQAEYAKNLLTKIQLLGLRVNYDLRNEKISFKIREHSIQRIPYLLIIGDREVASNVVTVRTRNGEDLGEMSIEVVLEFLKNQIQKKI